MLRSCSSVMKREVGEPVVHHIEDCLFGLDCLNPQLVSCLLKQELSPRRVLYRATSTHVGAAVANMGGEPLAVSLLVIVRILFPIKKIYLNIP